MFPLSHKQTTMYEAVNQSVFSYLPNNAKRILDIGCGAGNLGAVIKNHKECEIVGITYSQAEANQAAQVLDLCLVVDLNSETLPNISPFDCIICSHVLEHLYDPSRLLVQLHRYFTPGGRLIVALPNVLHWKQRLEFLRGHFKYTEGGLMDYTHFRFFDWQTAHELLTESGYQILESKAGGCFPLPILRKILPIRASQGIDRTALKHFPGLFGFQFVFLAKPR
ncbi:methyltransferase domain-containing protein [Trichothermofontia sp.]